MANPNKKKPKDSSARMNTTSEKLGLAAFGLLFLTTATPAVIAGATAIGGVTYLAQRKKKNSK